MKTLPWTDEEIRTSYRDSGKTNTQISILAQLNECTCKRICEIIGIKQENRIKMTEKERNTSRDWFMEPLKKCHAQGMTDIQIGKALCKPANTVKRWRERLGLEQNYHNEIHIEIDTETMQRLYNEGKNDPTIAKEMGIPLHRVKKWRKTNRLPPQKRIKDVIIFGKGRMLTKNED